MKLTPKMQKFILHWGDMGPRWGISRSVAQVHALLYLSKDPLNADEIAETLSIARSNVSICLRELEGWGVLKAVPRLGERKDYFTTQGDIWEMFRRILDERKRREVDPTVALLRECAEEKSSGDEYSEKRLREIQSFFEIMAGFYGQLERIPTSALLKFVRMGDKLQRLFKGLA